FWGVTVAPAIVGFKILVKVVEPYRLTGFNTQTEAKYALEHWIDKGFLALGFPAIKDRVHELGLGFIFAEPEECNLTL
ncbi:hypothetical protein HAX54_034495, partial [Datura stramonium]|nr:hypothetical protein [Datura stramonium]